MSEENIYIYTMEYYSAITMKSCHLWQMGCNKLGTEKQISHVLIHMWKLKNSFHRNRK
jgi:hypothetical protein